VLQTHHLEAVVDECVAKAGGLKRRVMLEGDGVAQLVAHTAQRPFLGERVDPIVAAGRPGEVADLLHHARRLIVRFFDEKAVVLERLGVLRRQSADAGQATADRDCV
jgi:hypothetical protein